MADACYNCIMLQLPSFLAGMRGQASVRFDFFTLLQHAMQHH